METISLSQLLLTIFIGTALVSGATAWGFVAFSRWSAREAEKAQQFKRLQAELSPPDESS